MITDKVKIYNMDCLDGLASIQSSSIDLVVTEAKNRVLHECKEV